MRGFWPLLVVCLSAACAKAPPVPDDHFYRLPELAPNARPEAPRLDGLVLVRALRTDGLHSERAIIYAEDERALSLKRYHYHMWLSSPPRLLRDYLVEHIRAAGLAPMVVTEAAAPADYVISGKIKRFERHFRGAGSRALVALELRLDRRGAARPVLLRDYRAEIAVRGDSITDAVAAFARGLDQTMTEFLRDARHAVAVTSDTESSQAAR